MVGIIETLKELVIGKEVTKEAKEAQQAELKSHETPEPIDDGKAERIQEMLRRQREKQPLDNPTLQKHGPPPTEQQR
jgi:hypothetical protein